MTLKDRFPELITILSYFLCGSYLAYILHSFNLPEVVSYPVWSLSLGVISALITALVLSESRRRTNRFKWWHNNISAVGCLLLMLGGILLAVDVVTAGSYLSGLGYGIVYSSGLAYINLRVNHHKNRVISTSLCYVAMLVGMSSSVLFIRSRVSDYNAEFGLFIAITAAILLIAIIANEICHRTMFYNCKMSLDKTLQDADEAGDALHSALLNSACQPNWRIRGNYTVSAITCKIIHGVVFANVFLLSAMMGNEIVGYYALLGGMVLGLILAQFISIVIIYRIAVMAHFVCLLLIFTSVDAAIVLWATFIIAGTTFAIPDVMIMEVSKPSFYEMNLFFGFLLQHIPIILSVNYVFSTIYLTYADHLVIWIYWGLITTFIVVLKVWVKFNYRPTPKQTLLETQHWILYNQLPPGPVQRPTMINQTTLVSMTAVRYQTDISP